MYLLWKMKTSRGASKNGKAKSVHIGFVKCNCKILAFLINLSKYNLILNNSVL